MVWDEVGALISGILQVKIEKTSPPLGGAKAVRLSVGVGIGVSAKEWRI